VSVPRAPLPHLVALVLGVGAAVAVGCGDRSNLIPAGKADSLTQQLADIKSRIDQGDCDGITDDVRQFREDVIALGKNGVDTSLRRRLREGADALLDTAADDCAQARNDQTQTETTDTTTTETDTTPTDTVTTVETQTQPTDTATQPTPTTTEPPTATEPPATTEPDGVTGTTPDNGNGGVVPPEGDEGTVTP
jgi:hypothetical protein